MGARGDSKLGIVVPNERIAERQAIDVGAESRIDGGIDRENRVVDRDVLFKDPVAVAAKLEEVALQARLKPSGEFCGFTPP
jgi:hypothetical protein